MDAEIDLPLTATHWGTYAVETHGDRVTALHGFSEDADVSPIGPGIVETLDAPNRISSPMVRQSWLERGPGAKPELRGEEPFVAISWDKAHKLVAQELTRIKSDFGNEAIFAGSYGWASAGRFHHAQSQLHRFLNCFGGYTRSVNTYSFAAAEVAVPHILGDFRYYLETTTPWESIVEHTDLFVAFGGVPLKNGQINSGGVGRHCQRESLQAAARAEVEFVLVSPLKSDLLDDLNSTWLAPRPCTDAALLLAIAHTLIEANLHDSEFIERYTVGFEQVRRYLSGELDGVIKDAQWAATICEIDAQAIRDLARRMARGRTMISVSWSLTRQDHGEQPFWAAITVAALLGQIGLPGGGIGFGYSAINSIGNKVTAVPVTALPQGENPIKAFIPVARIADMLLNPGAEFEFNGERHRYPDIRLIYWAGGNPFHHHQDLNRLLEAWRKPETIIVHEWCWNAQAKFADIVLPCTTPLERNDIAITPRDPYWVYMQQAIPPHGEARDDYEIFRGIARELGFEKRFTNDRDAADWLRWLFANTAKRATERGHEVPDFDDFRDQRWLKLAQAPEPVVMLSAFRAGPGANPLKTPSGKIELFSEKVAGFNYPECPGYAKWLEPAEWLGQGNDRYPLHLISNQPVTKLHSQLDHGTHSRANKIANREPVTLNAHDAAVRGINADDIVRIYNDRGACLAGAVLSEDIRPGVIQLSTGAWFDPQNVAGERGLCKHGNPNVLTLDKGTSRLGQGPIAHSCLVEVERFNGTPPPLTAFDPPPIV